jgi:hypothetical protein
MKIFNKGNSCFGEGFDAEKLEGLRQQWQLVFWSNSSY